jgi:hypothetical protein
MLQLFNGQYKINTLLRTEYDGFIFNFTVYV